MWVDYINKYAYLEPLGTLLEYRKMKLETIGCYEKNCTYGAEYCFGGFREFYHQIGFETVGFRNKSSKTW